MCLSSFVDILSLVIQLGLEVLNVILQTLDLFLIGCLLLSQLSDDLKVCLLVLML